MILGIDGCQAASHRSTCTGLYMNGSRCHEDMVVGVMKIWAVGHRRLTPSKFSFKGYSANEWGRCQRGCPVLMSLVSRGCAMQSRLSPARCRFARWSRRSGSRSRSSRSLNGGVSYKACRHETSPCPGVGEIPVEAVVSPVVPVD